MNKKLLTIIKKYPLQTKIRSILNCVHTVASNKTILTEATNSSIAIRHFDTIENDLSFEILQDLDGNYIDFSGYPKLEKLFNPDLLNIIEIESSILDEITVNVMFNHKNMKDTLDYILNEVHYTISTKYLKIVMDTINIFKYKKVYIGTSEKYKPIYFLIEGEQGKTEILLSTIRKWDNNEQQIKDKIKKRGEKEWKLKKMQLKQIKLIITQIEFSQQRIKDLTSYLTFLNNGNCTTFIVRHELKDYSLNLNLHESVLINEINDEINRHKRTIERLKESIGVE